MELQLQFENITCFETLGSLTASHEETMETAIPEYCPDIARIVDTVGQLCIREKLPGKDHYTVSGTVKMTVLYTSEEASGLRSLRLSIPFSCQWEDPRLCQCQMVAVTGRVLLAEARAITSRKLYLRVLPEITITPYCQVQRTLCSGLEEDKTLRIRQCERTVNCLGAVCEKQFTFTQDVAPMEDAQMEDLLLIQLCPRVHSLQRIGNKFSLKGEMELHALYRNDTQNIRAYDAVLPMAEILEGAEMPEDATYVVTCSLSECDGRLLRADTGCALGITAGVTVQICAYCQRTVTCVEDVYSVCCQTEIKRESVNIPVDGVPRQIVQEAQQRLEFAQNDPFVFVTQWDLSPVAAMREDNTTALRTALHMKILYMDENGAPLSTERTVEVAVSTGELTGNVTATCCGMTTRCSGVVCQLQGQVVFNVANGDSETVDVLRSVSLCESQAEQKCPSLVLRRMSPQETLWDIAKQYQTDMDAIVAANPEGIDSNRLLLIPKIR